ncbi:MAG: SDR family NAD(P)-dependent oxidoreductase [Gorillibacterium sp.]|nr:SDR family NAD(P)-dependent oxidoreductase [Gorillibacterium sp.]
MLTKQIPIGSGSGASTTASEIISGCDLSGKNAIVTGGYSGIGLEATRALSSAGVKVIVSERDYSKAQTALEGLDGVEIEAMVLGMMPYAVDPEAADRLWSLNEQLLEVGQHD